MEQEFYLLKMKNKKGQTSFEFLILVGFVLLAFAIFFLSIHVNLEDELDSRANEKLKEIAFTVKSEVDLAFESIDGYSRNFTLPNDIYGEDYDIWINQSTVFVERGNGEDIITLPLQEITGQINKFENRIIKEDGEVRLN